MNAAVQNATPELFLIDGSSFLFRSYYQSINQDPKYNVRGSDGLPTGAVRLFMTKILQILEKGAAGVMPTHVVVAFDVSRAGWRRELYPDYKSSREAPPDDLKPQMPYMRHAVQALGVTYVEMERFEADDIIATYADQASRAGANVTLISADKDIMQLVDGSVRFFDFQSGSPGKPGYRPERNYDIDGVREAWDGLLPSQIVEAQALLGDTVDDIPGVKGIGIKTAVELIGQFGTVEAMLARTDEIPQKKRRETIEDNAATIRMSRQLAQLDRNVPLELLWTDFVLGKFDFRRAAAFAKALDFPAILKRLCRDGKLDPNLVDPTPEFATAGTSSAATARIDVRAYSAVASSSRLEEWYQAAAASGRVGLFLLQEGDILVGAAIATSPGSATYIPVGHEETGTLFGGRFDGQCAPSELAAFLKSIFQAPDIRIVGHDIKSAWRNLGFDPFTSAAADIMLMSYALDNGRARHSIEDLSSRILGHHLQPLEAILGSGKSRLSAVGLKPDTMLTCMAERADVLLRLHDALSPRMTGKEDVVYRTLELPMAGVLARMEDKGVKINAQVLADLSSEFSSRMAVEEKQAFIHAGGEFQISSPKQVGDVLFDRLGLPGAKKTPTGQWETTAGMLDDLAAAGHAVASHVLAWRQMAKLKSTYADALRQHLKAGRVHTTFSLAATPTARLSSNDPGLQNIPVRTEDGRRIRTAFEAEAGRVIVSADYSQIELRLLAHVADVTQLQQAFADGIDIHAMTASEMFGVPVVDMPSEIRRSAKAINFGIIYGISPFGLARQLGIPVPEAADYIGRYFRRFPGIRDYMEAVKDSLARDGYVETIFGRRIHFPFYGAAKGPEKANMERAAINAPIQGAAADVIRRAMIRMEEAVVGLGADMLLQVHDELLFEVDETTVAEALPVIRRTMEEACAPDINLSVPLIVEANAASNWGLAH